MKKIILFALLIISIKSFSQSEIDFDFNKFSNPDAKNDLSLYFKDNVPKKLLKNIRFPLKKNNIILSFYLDTDYKPYNITISALNSVDLKKAITEAFEKYPLEKLSPTTLNSSNRYSLQIITKKGFKNIFNCSSKIIEETPPICEPCEDLTLYEDIRTCLHQEVEKHFYNTANFTILNANTSLETSTTLSKEDISLLLTQEVDLFIDFSVAENGKLVDNKTKVPSVFKNEVVTVFNSFPYLSKPATINGVKKQPSHCFIINYRKNEKPEKKDWNLDFLEYSKPNSNNILSNFYSDKLSIDHIQKAQLNRIRPSVSIYFELDENNKPSNISTNAKSNLLDKELISILNQFPAKELNIENKSAFNNYMAQILSLKNDQNTINASSIIGYRKIPVFPGCENSKNLEEAKNCFSKAVQVHFSNNFDTSLPNKLGLSRGKKSIYISFRVDKEGYASNINVEAPHIKIEQEVLEVMKKLPKAKPAMQNGKEISIKYSIPFTLIVQ